MKLNNLPLEFKQALPVLAKLQAAGFLAYFVGGSVRDSLLGRYIHDVDIATSATPYEVKKIFCRTIDIGIEHGTVLVLIDDLSFEITTFRTEDQYQDFRRPKSVAFVRSLSDDLKRRDFTVNALAMDSSGEIIDLFDGLTDLSAKIIRAVGNPSERFGEDALRILRAFRFVSVLGFEIDSDTLAGIAKTKHLLAHISAERIEMELSKLLVGSFYTQAIGELLKLEVEQGFPADITRGLKGLAKLNLPLSLEAAWVLLCYFNQSTPEEVKPLLKAFKHSNSFIKRIMRLLSGLYERLRGQWTIDSVYSYGLSDCLAIEALADSLGQRRDDEQIRQLFAALPIHHKTDLAINGTDILAVLDKKQGSWLGEVLSELEYQVLHGRLDNRRQDLLDYLLKLERK
ncbi:MAG: CCA tRNA nucleotidyltransferase [Streptococcaceae bacterium]|jgi:tRNA nucleotidyltransferase (CCA-adding enzyme)|nr:CCA tRNA nucleotidyltransferase [Streptococcaceae bacterium]